MALATQCPHCHTTFRVAHDQLKLRAGLVRCGACKQIFNGIENLVPIDQVQPPESPPSPTSPSSFSSRTNEPDIGGKMTSDPAAHSESSLRADAEPLSFADNTESVDHKGKSRSEPTLHPTVDRTPDDPLLRMTLLDFAPLKRRSADDEESEPSIPASHDGSTDLLDKAIDDLQNRPIGKAVDTAHADTIRSSTMMEADEPRFMRQGRQRERMGKSVHRLMMLGSIVLSVTLLVQGLYLARNQLAASYPQLRPTLRSACAVFGCQISLPAQIDSVSIESSELQAINPDRHIFAMTALLRNRSATPQAWPYIELTLTNSADKAVARRVFTAQDYLPAGLNQERGFSPRSEQTVKVVFELSQLDASGYRVYLFYP